MIELHSKTALLHRQLRRALQSGRYLPGQRIDPAALAREFKASTTPVRQALYRLVGEHLIEDQARNGFVVPLPSEIALRNLYDWMERLLVMACDIGVAELVRQSGRVTPVPANGDPVKRTWKLFDAVAHATAHHPLHQAVRQANDRLAPIRRAKHHLLTSADDELDALAHHWERGDTAALRHEVRAYHARRKQLVPCIVAVLIESSGRLH
ncbi:GntR family transcriptional regulator [Luteimonas sp. WGS1318]|uniref:GntR family transcriptional regulator n=1 Tax=Luteimonas sp. WGS1318 TaxID=3366815 RepID=UPI00372D324F